MNRRTVISLLGGAAAWPLAAQAQQPVRLPIIGLLGAGTAVGQSQWTAALVQRLRELGWNEGRTIAIQYRWADGRRERYDEIAAEFVQLRVDVIVTQGAAAVAARRATSAIPIVFALAGDPVGAGLVASLARPGGNVTGLSLQQADLAGKRLALLREMLPGLRRLAVMANPENLQTALEMREVHAAAEALQLELSILEIRSAQDITRAFANLASRAEALYVVADPIVLSNRMQINILAAGERLPTMHGSREQVEAGGLISYGAGYSDLWRRAGDYIDKILRGVRPADIPIEQPTKFELVVNLAAAVALRIDLPPTLLARADEAVE
jgi:putative ABC transport system substrate-binding protein